MSNIITPQQLERDYRLALKIHDYFSKARERIISRSLYSIILKSDGTLEIKHPETVEKLIQKINELEESYFKKDEE